MKRRRSLRQWWRSLRPPRTLKITKSGRTYLLITLGVGVGALNTGNNLLYLVLGLLLSLVVVSGILSERVLVRIEAHRIGADAAFAGEDFSYRWMVRSKGGAAFAIQVEEDQSPLLGKGAAGYIATDEQRVVRATMKAPRRGPIPLTGIRITTTFPLGLFAKTRVIDERGTLLVYPQRRPGNALPPFANQSQPGESGNPLKKDGTGDLLGLRELRPEEDSRQVHWLKSATAGKLLRTEREREERRAVVLELPQGLPMPALDTVCEQLASQLHMLITTGYEVGLSSLDFNLRPAAGTAQELRVLKALAVAGYEGSHPV